MPDSTPLEVRAAPVQQRGQERVDKLLDATARIIEESGIAGLTTSAVAEQSGSSVGVVYRYFPNIDSLVFALAERNLERYMGRLRADLESGRAPDWRSFVRLAIDIYAEFARTEPGFSRIRFGDIVAMRFTTRQQTNNRELADALSGFMTELYGFPAGPDLDFATEVAMEVADGLTRRAFQFEDEGDYRFVRAAMEQIIAILEPHAPKAES